MRIPGVVMWIIGHFLSPPDPPSRAISVMTCFAGF